MALPTASGSSPSLPCPGTQGPLKNAGAGDSGGIPAQESSYVAAPGHTGLRNDGAGPGLGQVLLWLFPTHF